MNLDTIKQNSSKRQKSQLEIIEKDQLQALKEKKDELEKKLMKIEFEQKENTTPLPKKQRQNSNNQFDEQSRQLKKQQLYQQEQYSKNIQEISRKQDQFEMERQNFIDRVKILEKDKKQSDFKYEKMLDDLKVENYALKENILKINSIQSIFKQQNAELEGQRNQLKNELKKQKLECMNAENQILDANKKANEMEAFAKQSKIIIEERDNRIEWAELKLQEEEKRHRETRQQVEQLKLNIKNLQIEIDGSLKEKERLGFDIEQISKKHNSQYDELHEVLLKERRDTNELHSQQQEYLKIIKQKDEKIRNIELERERMLVRLEDLGRMEERLRLKDRQMIQLELELEKLHREKGNTIVERIIREVPQGDNKQLQSMLIQNNLNEDRQGEFSQLREQLLEYYKQRDELADQVKYWKKRFEDSEQACERAVELMRHQTGDVNEKIKLNIEKSKDAYDKLKSAAISFINGLQIAMRKREAFGIDKILDQHKGFLNLIAIKPVQ